jgi:hypothetical protein
MNKINESVFQKPKAQDDKGLEEEAKSLLVRILGFLCMFICLPFIMIEWEGRHP